MPHSRGDGEDHNSYRPAYRLKIPPLGVYITMQPRLAYRLETIYRGPGLDDALFGNGVMGQSQDLRASEAVNHIRLLRPASLCLLLLLYIGD
jgi:hypothetical protein